MERFRRRLPSRSPKARVVVVTEGEVTKPGYLGRFHRLHGSASIRLAPIPLGGDPRAVVERAVSEQSDSESDPDADRDTFWAMFDRDEHQRFREAVDLARAHNIGTAVSDPCFELWAVLYYELWDRPSNRRDCQRRLGELCPTYGASSGKRFRDEPTIRDHHEDAVKRARTLVVSRCKEGQPLGNPSTTVHELMEHIRRGGA